MFGIFRGTSQLISPISGNTISLRSVPDMIFSQGIVGQGIAIDSTGDIIIAPADGEIKVIFETNHAFAMIDKNGVELLIHIGLDTIELNGDGFERLVDEGQCVKAGDPIIKIDREKILKSGYSLIVPVVITNTDILGEINCNEHICTVCGRDVILSYRLR
ncbi:MAG: PTS glucose transporter subunit IIA [Bacillota bacterium]|nr:PTS glucose transporter subunit IIA [Bacillota bacterium]